jgi:2-keto-4-pentenoate hydratase/2-oxohepta-3-ene-1,7-dioic acid hydratase in catechol pathway
MKLLRFGPKGREKPGILDAGGTIRDLSGIVDDLAPATIAAGAIAKVRKVKPEKLPAVRKGVRIGPCISTTGNFIAIGINYADHAAESGSPVPREPILFNKAPSCICGPNDDTIIPKGSTKLDWEVELGVVIGRRCRYVARKDALGSVAGYCIVNDVSERYFQMDRGGQTTKGKSAETFGPIGPWLVTPDEVPNPQRLGMWTTVNDEPRQNGSTRTMIFGVAHLIWYCSQFFVLEPGDIITTGTPPGVALGMKPPRYLKAGDVVRLGIDGLGEQRQTIVKFRK